MDEYIPIHCDLHDHVEIACLYRYRLRLATSGDRIMVGEARTTETDRDKQEWLLIETKEGDARIRLDEIRIMQALTPGARFDQVDF